MRVLLHSILAPPSRKTHSHRLSVCVLHVVGNALKAIPNLSISFACRLTVWRNRSKIEQPFMILVPLMIFACYTRPTSMQSVFSWVCKKKWHLFVSHCSDSVDLGLLEQIFPQNEFAAIKTHNNNVKSINNNKLLAKFASNNKN